MPAKFEIYLDKSNAYRFRLKAANGEPIASGESYPDRKSVLKGIASIQKNAPIAIIDDTTVEKKEAKPKAAAKAAPKAAAKTKAAPKAAKPKAAKK